MTPGPSKVGEGMVIWGHFCWWCSHAGLEAESNVFFLKGRKFFDYVSLPALYMKKWCLQNLNKLYLYYVKILQGKILWFFLGSSDLIYGKILQHGINVLMKGLKTLNIFFVLWMMKWYQIDTD